MIRHSGAHAEGGRTGHGPKVSDEARQKLRTTLEAAGVEFINGSGPGVRLKPRRRG